MKKLFSLLLATLLLSACTSDYTETETRAAVETESVIVAASEAPMLVLQTLASD